MQNCICVIDNSVQFVTTYTVLKARPICLMKMHPRGGSGTSSNKCFMTLIYFAVLLSSNQAKKMEVM